MRLLVAEDEVNLADALKEILEISKYSVDVVHDGIEALEYIRETDYDGIILDIMMPKLDGINVLKQVRHNKNKTPILMLTAKSEVDDKVLGLDSGADDYLTKPFATKELLARIRTMTGRAHDSIEHCLELGNIRLSRLSYELSSEKKSFVLTNKEFQLMEFLFNSLGRYITSEQLMAKIWGFDSDSEINVVWTYLSGLRKKLEQIGANVKIRSARNLGYTLEVINDA